MTVLVIMDPLGNVPIFLGLTQEQSQGCRRRAALQAVGVAAGVIFAFALFGQQILLLLGISLEALQVAGGLLLVLVALDLLRPAADDAAAQAAKGRNVAFVPLGTPLLAGPGAIAVTMLYIQRAEGVGGLLSVAVGLAAAHLVVYLALRYSLLLDRLLKPTGINLISRVMGFLLAAIAVQLVASGVATWVRQGVGGG